MKKRIISIASFALIAFATFSCGNRLQNSETTGQIGPDIVIKCDTFKLHEKLLFDNKDKSSPYLCFDFEMPYSRTGNKDFDNHINKAIAVMVCGNADIHTIEDAHKEVIKNEYTSYCDFIHSIMDFEEDIHTERNNHYLERIGLMETGYKGFINYSIIDNFYEGGAHPCHAERHFNIDPKNGNIITLDDVFKGDYLNGLIPHIEDAVAEYFECKTFKEALESTNVFNEVFVPDNYLLQKDSIAFIFDELEIARRHFGSIEVKVPYNKIKGFLK